MTRTGVSLFDGVDRRNRECCVVPVDEEGLVAFPLCLNAQAASTRGAVPCEVPQAGAVSRIHCQTTMAHQAQRESERARERESEGASERERAREREIDRERETETETEAESESERARERESEKEREEGGREAYRLDRSS